MLWFHYSSTRGYNIPQYFKYKHKKCLHKNASSACTVDLNMLSTANIQPLFEIQKEKAGNICEKVNYKLPLRHESKKRHSI